MKEMIRRKPQSLTYLGESNETPLHQAAMCGKLKVVQVILKEAEQNVLKDVINVV